MVGFSVCVAGGGALFCLFWNHAVYAYRTPACLHALEFCGWDAEEYYAYQNKNGLGELYTFMEKKFLKSHLNWKISDSESQ